MPLSRSTTPTPLVIIPPSQYDSSNFNNDASGAAPAARSPSPVRSAKAGGGGQLSRSSSSSVFIGTDTSTPTRTISYQLPHLSPNDSPTASKTSYFQPPFTAEPQEVVEASELDALSNRLLIETKIKNGAENLLKVFKQGGEEREGLRTKVEAELASANKEIEYLERKIRECRANAEDPRNTSPSPDASHSDGDSRTAVASTMDALRSLADPQEQSASFGTSGTSLARQDQQIEIMNALVQTVRRNERVKWEIPCQALIDHLLPCLSDRGSQNLRAAVYRTLRYLCFHPQDAQELITEGLELFFIRTFSRNATFELEKTEALLLVRSWITTQSKPSILSVGIIRALVSLCENTDEKLRFLALESLAELVLYDVNLLIKSEGLRVILQALVEGPFELSPYLATAFIPIMDLPETRRMLRPGLDIELVTSSFATVQFKSTSHVHDERLKTSATIVGMYLKSWTGLIYLCMNDKQSIRSFLGGIISSSESVRSAVLNTLLEIFRIDFDEVFQKKWNTPKKAPLAPTKSRLRSDSASRPGNKTEEPQNRLNLIDHYLGLLLLVLVEAGLLDNLIAHRSSEGQYDQKAAVLVGELLTLSMRVLPIKYSTQWQTLPRLFGSISHFEDLDNRLRATVALNSIDKYTRHQTRQKAALVAIQNSRNRANSLEDSLTRGQRHFENSRIRLGMQIDDNAWKNKLLETQVLLHKEHTKWNYDAILEVVEGPLLNPARLNEAIRGTKFLRRLMVFYYPFERRYTDMENSPTNLKWTKLGCALLTTLVATPDGIAFLQQDRLLRQIAECLGHLDPYYAGIQTEAIFGERRFASTLASGYFSMLGTLSKYPEGLKLMEKAKVFTLLYHLTDLKGREDIVTAAIENLDYENDGHARVVLSKALNSSYKHVRLFATKHLGKLLNDTAASQEWLIQLLVNQLYDTSSEVREMTVSLLNEVCQDSEALKIVVETRPTLEHLGAVGAPLLVRFLSTSVGVRYLHEIEFIEREMERWFSELNDQYVVQLEVSLARALHMGPRSANPKDTQTFDGTVPVHFYGELVKTSEGLMILEAKGHFKEFAEYIRANGMEDVDLELMEKLKSVLWAVGHIGSTSGGVVFLESEGIIGDIVHIATHSKALSIRGTCFFVCGLIASTLDGAELLESCGWISAYTPIGLSSGYCYPEDVDSFLRLQSWVSHRLSSPPQHELGPPTSHIERDAIAAIANLSNNLLTHNASKALARIKHRHPEVFTSKSMYFRALHLLKTCHYRSTVRAYILDLFENVPLTMDSAKEIMQAGHDIRLARRLGSSSHLNDDGSIVVLDDTASLGSRSDVRESRKDPLVDRMNLPINPIYRLTGDSDSEDSDSSEDDEKIFTATVKGEEVEPLVIMRGFLAT